MSQAQLDFAAKVLPKNYVFVHTDAITWLYENYPEIYKGFYERVSGLTQRAPDADPAELFHQVCEMVNPNNPHWNK